MDFSRLGVWPAILKPMELLLVRIMSYFFSNFRFPGSYRIARHLHSCSFGSIQKGVWLQKSYLQAKYNLKINLFSKDLIDHKILFSGAYEEETNRILERHIKNNDIVVEAGANSGTETLLISRLVGKSGIVYAFEPVGSVAAKLKMNLELNDIVNVRLNPEALGESTKSISFFILPGTHPNQGMGSKVISNASGTEIEVRQITLDSLELNRLDFLKMDVQGAEIDILKGGRETITRFKPKIFLEANEDWSNIEELYRYLDELGYVSFYVASTGRLVQMHPLSLKGGNWLALPKNEQ